MSEENEEIFNYDFFKLIDLIIVAVDSFKGRHFLSDKAIL